MTVRLGAMVVLLIVWAAACASADEPPATVASTTSTVESGDETCEGGAADCETGAATTVPGDESDSGSTTVTDAPPPTEPTTTTLALADLRLGVAEVGAGFDAPLLLHADPDGGVDLVVEQTGRVVRVDDAHSIVLDITADVVYGGEQGLLGLAFHPEYSENRLAYVNYIGSGRRTVIEQFRVRSDGLFDMSSRKEILSISQPARNHNGGMIAFGPDGYLWIGMGDGGGSDDRFGNGQRADTLHGSMLRIAVGVDGVETYGIPGDNPGGDHAPEVWWTGLRNPWRFSFDGGSDGTRPIVYVADVGQREIEEVSVIPASLGGANLGWPVMEGSSCFQSKDCDRSSYEGPVIEYGHDEGCSITGGYVYRGNAIPELDGHYFFSDYCSGFLRSWPLNGDVVDWTSQVGSLGNVSGFGIGGDSELYIITLSGSIYRLERVQ